MILVRRKSVKNLLYFEYADSELIGANLAI